MLEERFYTDIPFNIQCDKLYAQPPQRKRLKYFIPQEIKSKTLCALWMFMQMNHTAVLY